VAGDGGVQTGGAAGQAASVFLPTDSGSQDGERSDHGGEERAEDER